MPGLENWAGEEPFSGLRLQAAHVFRWGHLSFQCAGRRVRAAVGGQG